MEHNYGGLIAERHFKVTASFWFRFFGCVALVLAAFSAYYLIVDPMESETAVVGLAGLGIAALLFIL